MTTSSPESPAVLPTTAPELRRVVFNLPNQLTWARLVLTIIMFVLIGLEQYLAGLLLFIVAASTDWLDGYLARKYQMVTTLGRILDPFADKVIICGTFIYLAAIPASLVRPWMVVVVVGRELLVTALRSFLEQQGADFSASMSGKLKMVLQCVAAVFSLAVLAFPQWSARGGAWIAPLVQVTLWGTVLITVYSGVGYIHKAVQLLRR